MLNNPKFISPVPMSFQAFRHRQAIANFTCSLLNTTGFSNIKHKMISCVFLPTTLNILQSSALEELALLSPM